GRPAGTLPQTMEDWTTRETETENRRLSMRTAFHKALCAATAIGFVCPASAALADGEVSLLTWEGYADDSFVDQFEEESGCTVSATYVGSNDDFAPKLAAGGGVYDLIIPSIDTTKVMIEAGFVQPIDLDKVPRWGEVYEKFRTAEGIQ